jgi:hypothetical protein
MSLFNYFSVSAIVYTGRSEVIQGFMVLMVVVIIHKRSDLLFISVAPEYNNFPIGILLWEKSYIFFITAPCIPVIICTVSSVGSERMLDRHSCPIGDRTCHPLRSDQEPVNPA